MRRALPFLLALRLAAGPAAAQDTLRVTLAQADSLLQARSLALVARRCEVQKAKADRAQARLFSNPSVATEWSIRPEGGRVFDVAAPDGQMAVSVEKLFRIAGQRGLAVRAAGARIRLAQAGYAEVAASLRLRLHAGLYRQFYLQRAVTAIGSQLDMLKGLVDAYDRQLDQGNTSLKEVARLRTAYFQLDGQRTGMLTELHGIQEELRTLLMEERTVVAAPLAREVAPLRPLEQDSLQLMALAEANRPEVGMAQADWEAARAEAQLQRRLAYPDLALGFTYDRNSNYRPGYTGLNAGISVPISDRNQGGIRRAQAEALGAESRAALARQQVRQEVLRALADLRALQRHYASAAPGLDEQLDRLSESLVGNYVRSNLSLLEFTDLLESYTSGIIAINALKADLQQAYEQLEYVTGQRLFAR